MPRGVTSEGTFTPVQVWLGDRAYNAHWHVENGVLFVSSTYGSAKGTLGRRKPERPPMRVKAAFTWIAR